jgi:hypothetical protein
MRVGGTSGWNGLDYLSYDAKGCLRGVTANRPKQADRFGKTLLRLWKITFFQ